MYYQPRETLYLQEDDHAKLVSEFVNLEGTCVRAHSTNSYIILSYTMCEGAHSADCLHHFMLFYV